MTHIAKHLKTEKCFTPKGSKETTVTILLVSFVKKPPAVGECLGLEAHFAEEVGGKRVDLGTFATW